MKRIAIPLAFISIVVLLSGCAQSKKMRQRAEQDEVDAKQYVDQLRAGKFDEIEHDADPGIFPVDGHQTLVSMAAMFPAQQPLSVKVVGSETFQEADFYNATITLEYEFPQQWVVVQLSTHEAGDTTWITSFQVQQMRKSLEDATRFTLVGKSALQYTVLFLAVSNVLLSICAFILCLRTRIRRWKWLWLIATLVGVCRFAIDWISGQLTFTPIWISLPPGGGYAATYGPWVLYATIPLGAILFLALRKQLAQSAP